MKKRTNVTSKNPIIIDLINLFSRLKLRVGFFRFVVELLILCRSPILLNNNVEFRDVNGINLRQLLKFVIQFIYVRNKWL